MKRYSSLPLVFLLRLLNKSSSGPIIGVVFSYRKCSFVRKKLMYMYVLKEKHCYTWLHNQGSERSHETGTTVLTKVK